MISFINKLKFYKRLLLISLSLGLPLMLQQVIVTGVNLVDNFMVASLGDAILASVVGVNRVFMVLQGSVFGLTSAVAIYVSQYYGAKQKEKLQKSFKFIILSSLFLTCIFVIFCFVYEDYVVSFFSKDVEVIKYGKQYLHIVAYSFIFGSISYSIYMILRSVGYAAENLYLSLVAVVCNTVFNYLLIYGNFNFPKLGIQGAAIATLIARVVEMIVAISYVVIKKYEFNFNIFTLFQIDKDMIKIFILKALPLCVNEFLWSLGVRSVLFKFYASRGLEVLSGLSVSYMISDLFFSICSGMSVATSVLVGSQLGANNLKKAKEYGYGLIGINIFVGFILSIIIIFVANYIHYLFPNLSNESISVAKNTLIVTGIFFTCFIVSTQGYFVLKAGGDVKNTLILDSGFLWFVSVPLIYIISVFTNISYLNLYIIGQIPDIFKMIFAISLVSKEKWVINLTN